MASYESDKEVQERVLEFLSFVRYCDEELPVFVGHSLFFKAFYSRRVNAAAVVGSGATSKVGGNGSFFPPNGHTTQNMLPSKQPKAPVMPSGAANMASSIAPSSSSLKIQQQKEKEVLVENLRRHRLSNATLMAVTVVFYNPPTHSDKINSSSNYSIKSDESRHQWYGLCDGEIVDAEILFGGGFHHQETASSNQICCVLFTIEIIMLFWVGLAADANQASQSKKVQAQQLLNNLHQNIQNDLDVGKKALSEGVKKLSGKLFDFFDK
jgi:hypothetical protein